ncbi:MAG: YggS family pyridoxal phosphate-dependent enzyme [Pseudomonadota bacterium]
MLSIRDRLAQIRTKISEAEYRYGRSPGSVSLLAVSKSQPLDRIQQAIACGQRLLGENYLQQAQDKISKLHNSDLEWHFIGAIQANKTRHIAQLFQWVHSVDRLKIATRLNNQRPTTLPPLDLCLQVNVSEEPSKAGVRLERLPELAEQIAALSRLRLRGLMAIPFPSTSTHDQRHNFALLREALEGINNRGFQLDTLSMGMSNDMEAAIAEGATMVRIGTAVFGPRPQKIERH